MTVVTDSTMPMPVAVGGGPGCGSGFPHHHQYCHPPPPPFAFCPPPNGHLGRSHCQLPFSAPALSPLGSIHQSPNLSPMDLTGSSMFGQSWPPSASFVPFHPPTPSTFSAAPNFNADCDQTCVQLPSRPPAPPFADLAQHLGESREFPPPMLPPFRFHHSDNLPNLGNYCRIHGPPPPPPPRVELNFPSPLGHPHCYQILRGPLPPPPPPHHCRTCRRAPPSRPPCKFCHGPHQIPRNSCVHPPSCSICETPIPFSHLHYHLFDDETKNCPFRAGPAPVFDSNSTPPCNDGGFKLDGNFSLHHLNHGPARALPFGLPPSFGGFRGPQLYHCGNAINVDGSGPCHHIGDCRILCGPPPPFWPPFGLSRPAYEISHGPSGISRNPHHLGVQPPLNSCPICEPPISYSDLHHHPSNDESTNHPLRTSAPRSGSTNGTPPRCNGGTNLDGFASSAPFDHRGPIMASLPLGPPLVFGGFLGPSFYHPSGHVIDHVNGMGPCHHHQVGLISSATPMSSDLSSDHVVKNITTEHLINPQGNVSEGSGDKSNQQDGLKSDNNLDPSR